MYCRKFAWALGASVAVVLAGCTGGSTSSDDVNSAAKTLQDSSKPNVTNGAPAGGVPGNASGPGGAVDPFNKKGR